VPARISTEPRPATLTRRYPLAAQFETSLQQAAGQALAARGCSPYIPRCIIGRGDESGCAAE